MQTELSDCVGFVCGHRITLAFGSCVCVCPKMLGTSLAFAYLCHDLAHDKTMIRTANRVFGPPSQCAHIDKLDRIAFVRPAKRDDDEIGSVSMNGKVAE